MIADDNACVLIIEDDADTRDNLCDILALDDLQVVTAGTAAAAMQRDNWQDISCVILDRRLPDGSATELLPRIKRLAPHAPVIIVTGYSDLDGAIAALRDGAADYILKPINAGALRASLARIIERKRTAREIERLNTNLQRAAAELQTLLDVFPSDFAVAIAQDPDCRFIHVNDSFARMLGIASGANASCSAQVEQDMPFRICQQGRDIPPHDMPVQRAARDGAPVRGVEFDVVRRDGRVISLLGHAAPLFDEHGRTRGAIGAFLDITDRKLAQERLMQQERLAAIGETMAGLVHEGRNALQRSKACLEMLAVELEGQTTALDLVVRTQRAQEHLFRLYEEVRQYAAPINLRRERCHLGEIWRETWAHLAHLVHGKQITLAEQADVDLYCEVDRFAISQVLRNVFENAIQASPDQSSIVIRCECVQLHGQGALRCRVRDQGTGMNAEQRLRVFDPFYTTKTKGTGLGMAIVKRIVQAHGGTISVSDHNGPGAEIDIILPRGMP